MNKTEKKTLKTPGASPGLSKNLLSPLREVGIIALAALAGYLFVSLFTWSPDDPGFSHTGSAKEIANTGGKVGAWISDGLFTGFGRMSWLLLALLCVTIWRKCRERFLGRAANFRYFLTVSGFVAAMAGGCVLEHIYFPIHDPAIHFVAGGIIGQYGARVLQLNFGTVGATVILLGLLVTGITLVGQVSWFYLMDRTGWQAFVIAGWARRKIAGLADGGKSKKAGKAQKSAIKRSAAASPAKKPPKIEPRIEDVGRDERKQSQSRVDLGGSKSNGSLLPELSLLDPVVADSRGYSTQALETMSRLLVQKLKDFNIDISVEEVCPGPVITRFEIEPAAGVKASQIVGLARDLARSLSVASVRVVENIPGKTTVGIEVPNEHREIVRLVEGLSSMEYASSASPLTLVLGKDIAGNPVVSDLARMPHVLIAGTTGSGKSVCVNALVLSLIYKSAPEQVRMIMVDPKFLELSVYDGIPHLLTPVVTDMNKAANALRWCIGEMDRRFRIMAEISVRNIAGFNRKVEAADNAGKPLPNSLCDGSGNGAAETLGTLPYIVVIVDELADLMMVAGKKIEEIIIRIAQRARAAGIHLVLATQRPSVDVVTGLIKANVPTRMAFQVSSRVDSRTVLDQMGAEQLLGQGDMLFLPPGTGFTQRVHGSFVSDGEVANIVAELKRLGQPVYDEEVTEGAPDNGAADSATDGEGEADPLYDEAVRFVTRSGKASISSVQRVLRVGYNRAARMIETMEQTGVVSPSVNGKREVLAPGLPETD